MKRTYTVFCKLCYSWQKSGLTKNVANREATSHGNMYQHDVVINEEYKPDKNSPFFNARGKVGAQS